MENIIQIKADCESEWNENILSSKQYRSKTIKANQQTEACIHIKMEENNLSVSLLKTSSSKACLCNL